MPTGIPKPAKIYTVRDKVTKGSPHSSRFASPKKSNGNQTYNINAKNNDYKSTANNNLMGS